MRVEVLGWAAVLCLLVGLSTTVGLAFTAKGPVRKSFNRYLGFLDRQRRALFIKASARELFVTQVLAVLAVLAYAALRDETALVLAFALVIAPRFVFPFLRRKRLARIEDQLDAWLTIVANMLQVTASLTDALAQSLDLTRGPLGQEVDLLLKEVKLGMPLQSALRGMADRIGSDLVGNIVTVMVIGRTSGGALPTLLEETAATLRERKRLEGVVRKHTASTRIQLIVMLLAPFVVIYFIKNNSPAFFDPFFNSALGWFLVAIGLICWVMAAMLARKILRVDI